MSIDDQQQFLVKPNELGHKRNILRVLYSASCTQRFVGIICPVYPIIILSHPINRIILKLTALEATLGGIRVESPRLKTCDIVECKKKDGRRKGVVLSKESRVGKGKVKKGD